MPALLYTAEVSSPCVGDQLVNMLTPGFFAGASGNFTYVILFLSTPTSPWRAIVFDRSEGACAPQIDFEQVNADPNDPVGEYHALGPNGKDPNLGEMSISPFP